MTRNLLFASVAPLALRPVYASAAPLHHYRHVETPTGAARAAESVAAVNGDEMLRRSPDSAAMLDYWDLTDTLVDGHDAMKRAGTKYLPKFADEGDAEYNFRLQSTKFTNVYRDIVESLSAKPFEQEVTLIDDDNNTTPSVITDFIEDVDGSGNNLTSFASATFFNGINSAIGWIFVDYPPDDGVVRNIAQANQLGRRPFWSHVLGRNILRATSEVIEGRETLTYIKIYEPGTPDHIREFERIAASNDGPARVVWRLYRKSDTIVDGKTQFILDSEGPVTIGVIPLVPFATGRRDGRTFRYFPAMRDAADLQVELYQAESGLKFAKILAAYPMLTGNGVKPEKDAQGQPIKLKVGPGRVLYAPPDGNGNIGSWAYIEPSASSLTFLANDIKETIQQLRELGRQPLTAQSGNLTVITAAAAAGKAKSAVGAWALALKDALENALVITCMFLAIRDGEYSPQVNVYTEFDQWTEGKDLDALASARTSKDISQETYHSELKRRGVLSPEFDHDIERERLLAELPDDDGDDVDPDEIPTRGGLPRRSRK